MNAARNSFCPVWWAGQSLGFCQSVFSIEHPSTLDTLIVYNLLWCHRPPATTSTGYRTQHRMRHGGGAQSDQPASARNIVWAIAYHHPTCARQARVATDIRTRLASSDCQIGKPPRRAHSAGGRDSEAPGTTSGNSDRLLCCKHTMYSSFLHTSFGRINTVIIIIKKNKI